MAFRDDEIMIVTSTKLKLDDLRDVSTGGGIDGDVLTQQADGSFALEAAPGASGGTTLTVETPSGTIDGANVTFTVVNEPVFVTVNGVGYSVGAGYSYAAGTITFDNAPATGSIIRSFYNA